MLSETNLTVWRNIKKKTTIGMIKIIDVVDRVWRSSPRFTGLLRKQNKSNKAIVKEEIEESF